MPRHEEENSRRDLVKKGYKVLRVYLSKENKQRLDSYQINNEIQNVDLALDNILDKFFNNIGGKRK